MNIVTLIGNVTKEPDLRTTQTGKEVISFSVAINRGKDQTDFVPCVAWEQLAQIVHQYVRKGDKIGVTGRVTSRKHEYEPHKTRWITEVVAEKIDLLGVKEKTEDEIFL